MTDSLPVRDWKCTYYDETKKRWFPGRFRLFLSQVKFIPDNPRNATPMSLPFHAISAIERETTNLIFGAITLKLRDGVKHWISSFQSRESAFFVVVHFWKNYALFRGKPASGTKLAEPGELATLVVDAQRTLEGAACELHSQGRQVNHGSRMMNEIHSDLDIAEGMLKDMGSWLDMWRASKDLVHYVKYERKSGKNTGDGDCKYPVLFGIKSGAVHRPGDLVLRIRRRNCLTVYDDHQKEVFQAEAGTKLSLKAHTPYHFTLTKAEAPHPSNKPINIISVVAVAIIEDITKQFSTEVEYETPPDITDVPAIGWETEYTDGSSTGDSPLLSWTEAAESEWPIEPPRHQSQTRHHTQAQAVVRMQTREEELGLVSKGLEEMRQLAVSLGEETESQLQLLDQVDVSVDKATQRMKAATKRARELAN